MIPSAVLTSRRKKCTAKMAKESLFILFGAEDILRNSDVEYPFRQESSFWYLTGFNEPNAALILKRNQRGKVEEILYIQKREPEREIWVGRRSSLAEAKVISGVKKVKEWSAFEADMKQMLSDSKHVYFDADGASLQEWRSKVGKMIKKCQRGKQELSILPPAPLLRPLRLYKDTWEIEQMQKAAAISVQAHRAAIQTMRARIKRGEAVWEYQVAADLYHVFGYANTSWAYPAIVANGNNACTLHYIEATSQLAAGDLVLVGAACEYNGYAADITRCYPVSGTFSSAQKRIYELVLQAQLAGIEEVARIGATTLSLHEKVVRVLTKGLIELKILQGDLEENIEQKTYYKYFMHGTSHFLGLDVHDIGFYRDEKGQRAVMTLESGMVVTVEPGLYFGANDQTVPPEFRGIGIRIEDDVLKTTDGAIVLTAALPKNIQQMEQLCA